MEKLLVEKKNNVVILPFHFYSFQIKLVANYFQKLEHCILRCDYSFLILRYVIFQYVMTNNPSLFLKILLSSFFKYAGNQQPPAILSTRSTDNTKVKNIFKLNPNLRRYWETVNCMCLRFDLLYWKWINFYI